MTRTLAVPAREYRGREIRTACALRRARPTDDADARRVVLSFSSETPVDRWWGREILGHEPGEVDLSRVSQGVAPLLLDHRHDFDNRIGIVEKVDIVGRRWTRRRSVWPRAARSRGAAASHGHAARAEGRFGWLQRQRRATWKAKSTAWRPTASRDWTVFEISLVSSPADIFVGVGRSEAERGETVEIPLKPKGTEMTTPIQTRDADPAPAPQPDPQPTPAAPAQPVNLEAERAAGAAAERTRTTEIRAIGQRIQH